MVIVISSASEHQAGKRKRTSIKQGMECGTRGERQEESAGMLASEQRVAGGGRSRSPQMNRAAELPNGLDREDCLGRTKNRGGWLGKDKNREDCRGKIKNRELSLACMCKGGCVMVWGWVGFLRAMGGLLTDAMETGEEKRELQPNQR